MRCSYPRKCVQFKASKNCVSMTCRLRGSKLGVPLPGDQLEGVLLLGVRGLLRFFRVAGAYPLGKQFLGLVSFVSGFRKRYRRIRAKGDSIFLAFTKRYLRFQSLPPVGVTRRKSPPPSKSLNGLSAGLVVLIMVSASGTIRLGITISLLGVVFIKTTPKTFGFHSIPLYSAG